MMDIIARQLAKSSNNIVTKLENINIDTIEPTGFSFPDKVLSYQNNTIYVDLNFDESTRVFTIAPKSPYTSYDIYTKGTKITKTSLESVTISNNNGGHFIYFDDNGILKESLSNMFFTDAHIPVSYVYWNVEDQKSPVFALETHGCVLDHATHLYLHETIGAKYVNGLIAGDYDLLGDGSNDSDAQLSISNGQVDDEDIRFFITHSATPIDFGEQILSPIAYLQVSYRKGIQGYWTYDTENEFPVKQGTVRPQINKFIDGSWTTIDVSGDDKFIIMWLVSCNCKTPIKSIVSQGEYDTLEEAQAVSFADLDIGDIPAIESKPLWKLIYQTNSTYNNTPKCKLVDISSLLNIQGIQISSAPTLEHNTLTGRSAVESHPASAILYSNTSGLNSTNVQEAIDELQGKNMWINTGMSVEPSYTKNIDDTLTIDNTALVRLYDNNQFLGDIAEYSITGGTFTLTSNSQNYIVADYNSGSPIMRNTLNRDDINYSNVIPLFTTYRDENDISVLTWDKSALGSVTRLMKRFVRIERFKRENGLILSESSVRKVIVSSGKIWYGINDKSILGFDSSTDVFGFVHHLDGYHTTNFSTTQYNNLQYDDGNNLQTLSDGRYAVNWIFRNVSDLNATYYMLGDGNYTLVEALNSKIPSNIPSLLQFECAMVGRIIVKKGSDVAYKIETSYEEKFQGAGIIDHADLLNIGINTHDQIDSHISNISNPHNVTKSQVGLGNVDNTSDLNKVISTSTQNALNLKEDSLNKSTNISLGSSDVLFPTQNAVKSYVDTGLSNKEPNLTKGNLTAGSNKITIGGSANSSVIGTGLSIDVNESNLTLNNIGGTLGISKGGTNSTIALNNNRIMQSSGGSIIESSAIIANRALISDANGIPVHSSVTNTELGYLSGTTSSVQTQLNGKEPTITKNTAFNKNYGTTSTDVKMNGTQAVGSVDSIARIDHVHPNDTTKQNLIYYGGMFEDSNGGTSITLTTAGTYYQWTTTSTGQNLGVTYNATTDNLTINSGSDGIYEIDVQCSFLYSRTNTTLTIAVFKNNSITDMKAYFRTSNAQNMANASINRRISLVAGDSLDLRFTSTANNDTVTIYYFSFNINRIG